LANEFRIYKLNNFGRRYGDGGFVFGSKDFVKVLVMKELSLRSQKGHFFRVSVKRRVYRAERTYFSFWEGFFPMVYRLEINSLFAVYFSFRRVWCFGESMVWSIFF